MRSSKRFLSLALTAGVLHAQQSAPLPNAPAAQQAQPSSSQVPPAVAQTAAPTISLNLPHSHNPLDTYRAAHVPPPDLHNSARLYSLIQNGVLVLSLTDAIELALENNLDLAIARYNIPIAKADVLRTLAGGSFLGVNTGVVQNTPGGGVGGFGSVASGAGAGGTTGGAGGAGGGAGGLVQSTLGEGSTISSYDPILTGSLNYENIVVPLSSIAVYGVPTLRQGDFAGSFNYAQAFRTGTSINVGFNSDRLTSNSPYTFLTPELDSSFQARVRQHLLSGFGLGPNSRYIRIARNNQRISDAAFRLQVITTVTQIANMYWDLVAAYDDEQVKQRSLDYATQTLASARQQVALQAIPALDVTKDEATVANREGDLAIAKSQLQFQSLLIKNALTKNLDDATLELLPVRPVDVGAGDANLQASVPRTGDLVQQALAQRVELTESTIDLENRKISRDAVRNALLPQLDLVGYYGGTGLAGVNNPLSTTTSTVPVAYGGAFENTFNNTAPNYFVGVNLTVPLRNRVAKSDQIRSELESRQAELREQELRKQIRIEVRNAEFAVEQSEARVTSAQKGRDLSNKLFVIAGKEQELGAGSAAQTLAARSDLALSESTLVAARTAYRKALVELDRATGRTLEQNQISLDEARSGRETNVPR